MDAGKSSEWLPPGFSEKTEVKNGKNVKYYYNVTTGVKYHSKKDVIHCATEDFFRDAPQKTNCYDIGESFDNKFDAIYPKWLPEGWRMEEKIRKNGSSAGSTYKIYIDSSTGYKFYSKLAVARYLKTIDQNDAATEQPMLDNVGEPSLKPDMYLQGKSLSEVDCFPAKSVKRKKSSAVVASDSTSADGLPPSEAGGIPGNKSKRKTSFAMVDSKTTSADPISPSVAGSTPGKNLKRKKSFNVIDSEITSADAVPPLVTGSTSGKLSKRKKSFTVVDTETTPVDVAPPSVVYSTPRKKSKRKKSFTVVAVESTQADGLPPGWVKEIKTSKSGNKIRKDPYYIEPVNGYMFLSKKDALRYLETNDIGSCACMPKRKEFDNLRLNKNEFTPDNVGEPFPKSDTSLHSKSMTDADFSPQKRNIKRSSTMVAAESTSVEGLPNGWLKEIMTRKSWNKVDNVGFTNLKPDAPSQCIFMRDEDCISEKKNKHTSTMVPTESRPADGLPPGWIKEVKTSKSGNKIRKDSYYIDPVNGYVFLSKKDVLRYLETNDIGSCAITPKRRKLDSFKLIKSGIPVDNVGETFSKPESPLQIKSVTDEDCSSEQNKEKLSLAAVATESSSVEGLPLGWIKEIRTSKSGNKIRKDPYYTDSINGYAFRSKKDVSRYLETNDIGSCAITPKRRELNDLKLIENKISLNNADGPQMKPVVSVQSKPNIDASRMTEPKKEILHSSSMVVTDTASADGLPSGWIKEIKTIQSGDKIRKDLYYTDPVSGYVFRSRKDVFRFLKTNDIRSCAITPKKRETEDLKLIKNINPVSSELKNVARSDLTPDVSVPSKSMIDTSCTSETEKKSHHSTTVATEIASTDGLPPGWIKEIKTSQSGDKIRKDSFYTDPVSGYIFHSKKDVLRYLETKDIGSCAIRPKRREIDGPSLIKKKASSSPINKKLSKLLETQTKLFVDEESSANGAGGSSTKTQAASKTYTLTVASTGYDSLKEQFSCENSKKHFDMKMGPAHTKDCSKQGEKAMADVLAICSFINDAFPEEKLPESEMENRTHGTRSELRKSKKRDLNLPVRASKRLAKSEPEMLSNVELSERTRRAAIKRSSATSVPLPSDLDTTKKVADHANAVEETLRGEDPLNNVEKPLAEGNTTLIEELSDKVENALAEDNANLKEQTVGNTNGKQPNADATSQDTEPCYEFGDAWTDPCLEFAYKTLTGEILLDDTLPFPEIPYNQEGGTQTSASEEPTMFESEIPPGFESSNQNNTVGKVPASPSFYFSAVDVLFESEIPPGFESVAQNKNADKSPANLSLSSPQVSTETGFSNKSS